MKTTNFLTKCLIAHRGLHEGNSEYPENSMMAFKRAICMNYSIELDVHLTKDGYVIVFHDDNLKRMTGKEQKTKNCTLKEINTLTLLGGTQTIPLFSEVLKLVQGKVPIIVELKSDNPVGKLEKEVVKLLDCYQGEFAVKSFHPFIVRWFLKNRPNYVRGQILTNEIEGKSVLKKYVLNRIMLLNTISKPDFISSNIKMLPNKKIDKLRKQKTVLGWVIKNRKEMDFAIQYCDNEICEYII